ncbi:MAG: glycosyltransferase family 2 protein [Candidatus Bathyarchaeia archaeon]
MEVAVVLPSKDEQETIGICIDKIRRVLDDNGIKGEIIVADNSKDETPNIARGMGADVITPDRKGYGYAYRYAFKYLRDKHGKIPRYVIIGDADDTYDFAEIPRLLEPLKEGSADMVIGSRFKGRIERGAMPWHRRYIGNPVLTWFLNLFYGAGVSDAHSGFRAIRGEALERLELWMDGMEFASEMIVEAVRKGLRIREVPISYHRRRNARSKLSSLSDGWRHLKFMLMFAPDYLFLYPSLFISFAGILLMLSAFLNIYVGYTPGIHSLIAGSILLVSGYQGLFFEVFARVLQFRGLPQFLTLENGAMISVSVFSAGFVWILKMASDWFRSGFTLLPPVEHSVICLTLITLSMQTFLSTFMLSILTEHRRRWTS